MPKIAEELKENAKGVPLSRTLNDGISAKTVEINENNVQVFSAYFLLITSVKIPPNNKVIIDNIKYSIFPHKKSVFLQVCYSLNISKIQEFY